jgi:putative membrane protein
MTLSAQDHDRIAGAIRAVEARTSGEIICVLARSSTGTTAVPLLIAAVAALALPWALVAFTAMPVYRILTLQVAAFLLLAAFLYLPPIQAALLPRRTRRALAHETAMRQFRQRGLARKKDRTGILIFVSVAERYARIVADEGIAARVPQSHWQAAVDALIAHTREGRVADGFLAAIEICGNELAAHFPYTGAARDELPDRIYVI